MTIREAVVLGLVAMKERHYCRCRQRTSFKFLFRFISFCVWESGGVMENKCDVV